MKTEAHLNNDIKNIISELYLNFPELSKYIEEMPSKVSENDAALIDLQSLEEYYFSLKKVIENYAITHPSKVIESSKLLGYPHYPGTDDVYNQQLIENEINPEDPSTKKTLNVKIGFRNEKDFEDDMSGDDLDIPGSELDNQQESVGSEDEENNYYSLGGDNHTDLEEDNE